MIPKIIHYTWFSGEPFPSNIANCIESWKKFMPDYELRLWDMETIKNIDSIFLKQALDVKKWAYAADFVRLYAVYHYGGIYLDTDALVYKSFDKLLDCDAFIGKEMSIHINGPSQEMYLSSHCFGAEKGNQYIKDCLEYYDNRLFITSQYENLPQTLKFNLILLPYIQSEIAKQIGYDPRPAAQNIQDLKGLTIYPSDYFDCVKVTKNSYCKHLALGSWRDKKNKSEKTLTLWDKISWRILFIFEIISSWFGYMLIKKK